MEIFLILLMALVVSLGSIAISLNISKKSFESIFDKSTKAIRLIQMIARDISDDPEADAIASAVIDGLNYVMKKYKGKDKEYLIMAGVCYTEEVLARMDIEIDNQREQLINEVFVIAYDVFYA